MDPRVTRSRAQLKEALMSLARERRLDEITVADVTNEAGVNRSTFYQHYADKETLLADALEEAVDEMAANLLGVAEVAEHNAMPPQLRGYLMHIRDNAELYRRVLGEHGSGVVAARLRRHIGATASALIENLVPDEVATAPADVIGEALGGTALGVVTAWLRRDPLPPVEQAEAWLWPLLLGAFVANGSHTTSSPSVRS